jgi:hypothetical protein
MLLVVLGYLCYPCANEWSKARQNARDWYAIKSDLHPSSTIPLKWTPEKSRRDYNQRKIFDQVPMKFVFDSIFVNRAESYLIGINIEDSLQQVVLYTRDTIDLWVRNNLNKLMEQQAKPMDGKKRETYLVCGNISKYLVTESSVYLCTLSIDVRVKDSEGKLVWEGTITENSASWGRSLKGFVYQQSLSAALQNWFYSFANNGKVLFSIGRDISRKWNVIIDGTPVPDN